jgi:dienelactone hydrolase
MVCSPWMRAQASYAGAVVSDYALRTVLASAMTAVMFPGGLALDGAAEARKLEFYADLARPRDADAVFAPPPKPIPVQTLPGAGLSHSGGRVERLRFASPFEPLQPALRRPFLSHTNNRTARAQYWRHDAGPQPTLIVIHGFGASPAAFNARFFSLPEFFRDGWDVVLFTLPFHGGRRSTHSPFNGAELFAYGFAHFCEAMLQAICDLRVLLDYLDRQGAPRVGVTGLSLGGYTTALLAEVDDRLDFAIPNAAVTSIPRLIEQWFPANYGTRLLESVKGVGRDVIAGAAAVHSPLTYAPRLPRERLMVIGGRGDRMAPPEQSELLWEHWGEPEIRWFPGSHILHFGRDVYLTAMRELMSSPRSDRAATATARRRPARRRST